MYLVAVQPRMHNNFRLTLFMPPVAVQPRMHFAIDVIVSSCCLAKDAFLQHCIQLLFSQGCILQLAMLYPVAVWPRMRFSIDNFKDAGVVIFWFTVHVFDERFDSTSLRICSCKLFVHQQIVRLRRNGKQVTVVVTTIIL